MLRTLLFLKITITVLFWCIPLLFLPTSWLTAGGVPESLDRDMGRLLGCAYLALCVGYGHAWVAAGRGERLMAPLWAGLVSNGGAFLLLINQGISGHWQGWGLAAQTILWGSVAGTAIITLGLWQLALRPSIGGSHDK